MTWVNGRIAASVGTADSYVSFPILYLFIFRKTLVAKIRIIFSDQAHSSLKKRGFAKIQNNDEPSTPTGVELQVTAHDTMCGSKCLPNPRPQRRSNLSTDYMVRPRWGRMYRSHLYIAIQPVRAETVRQPYINNQIFSLALLLIVYVHVTFRPTDYHYFGDTSAYAMAFQKKAFYGTVAIRDRDIGFEYLTYWLSQLVNLKGYWFVLCSLYILPVFFALKKRFKQQYAVALVLFVCSLSFWGYGVNGLRNGIATSLVIFSFLVPNNDIKRIPVWIIACLFHQSVMLPIGCFLLTRLSNNPKHYLYLWGTFFLLMLVARDSFSTLLTNIPWFEQDKRMSEYLNMSYKGMEQMFSNIGFRWDFIIYSLIPIIAGVKYIYTYCYEDKLFIRLFNTYIASNAFWLLTIHVPYNNRFAYLSWFLYPIVLIYPLLKDNLINNQGERIKWIILCYYMFTYVMWIK